MNDKPKQLLFKIPESLHTYLKMTAAKNHTTMTAYLKGLIEADRKEVVG